MSNKESDGRYRPAETASALARDRISIAREIEENLKRVYQASLTEEVPDRFAKLLAQLREKEGKQ